MKTLFFLTLLSCVALQAEYVAEIQLTKVTDDQSEVVMNSTIIVNEGQDAIVTLNEENSSSTTLELRVTAD